MRRRSVVSLIALVITLVVPCTAPQFAWSASLRYVSASAVCKARGSSTIPAVEVSITNRSGLDLHIAYIGSFATDQVLGTAGLRGLRQTDPGETSVITISNGSTLTLTAPWSGGTPKLGQIFVALLVTSAGNLIPACGPNGIWRVDYNSPVPTVAGAEAEESAEIAAVMIGELESWRAYPALYVLLHTDSRMVASFGTVACWYAEQYGPPVTSKTPSIFSTAVDDVTFVNWKWSLNGRTYPAAAEVSYTQEIGFITRTDLVGAVEHLVRVDGIWRWFFGIDADTVGDHPAACGLPSTT